MARCTRYNIMWWICELLATVRWFSPDMPVSSTNNTYHHDITETLLKVALNTITLIPETLWLRNKSDRNLDENVMNNWTMQRLNSSIDSWITYINQNHLNFQRYLNVYIYILIVHDEVALNIITLTLYCLFCRKFWLLDETFFTKKSPSLSNLRDQCYISAIEKLQQIRFVMLSLFKEYLKFLNRLYDITWFGAVYA